MPVSLRIVEDDAVVQEKAARADAKALAAAQRLLDAGYAADARQKLAPLAATPDTPVRAHAALLDAGLALMSGRPAEALDVLARVPASLAPDPGYHAMIAASALRQLRRYPEAVTEAERAVAHGASEGRLLVLADAQKHAGKVADAIATLERVLTDAPEHLTALAQRAGYLHLTHDERAGEASARFEAIASRAHARVTLEIELHRAFIALARCDLDAAFDHLTRAHGLDPSATRAWIADEAELDVCRADPRLLPLS